VLAAIWTVLFNLKSGDAMREAIAASWSATTRRTSHGNTRNQPASCSRWPTLKFCRRTRQRYPQLNINQAEDNYGHHQPNQTDRLRSRVGVYFYCSNCIGVGRQCDRLRYLESRK
jgi:hypothetical protein